MFLGEDEPLQEAITPGEDVFMIGRFVDFDGRELNAPSMRFGHISVLAAGIKQPNGCTKNSLIVDMHSRTGYSGSPVFVYRTPGSFLEDFDGDLQNAVSRFGHYMKLLGIHWGQFPESWRVDEKKTSAVQQASLVTDGRYVEGLSGMTCVAPASAIMEALNDPRLRQAREKSDGALDTKAAASPLPEAASSSSMKDVQSSVGDRSIGT